MFQSIANYCLHFKGIKISKNRVKCRKKRGGAIPKYVVIYIEQTHLNDIGVALIYTYRRNRAMICSLSANSYGYSQDVCVR